MVEKKKHLDLPSSEDSFKKKSRRGGPLKIIERDYNDFSETQISKLNSIGRNYLSEAESMPDYHQELVFKIKTSQKVSDDNFRKQLKGAGIETLISKPGKIAEWIVTTKDPNFTKLKEKITERITKDKSDVIDGIQTFDDIKYEDKIGSLLKEKPLGRIEVAKLNINLTRQESDVQKLNSTISYINRLVNQNGYRIHDKLNTKNLCMLLVECNSNLLKNILKLDLVLTADRTPEFVLEKILSDDQQIDLDVDPPPVDANGILVMDSGILHHPLLQPALTDNGFVGLPDKTLDDERSHGTMVSGNSLYGNIESKISTGTFKAKFWVYSAKIFYQSGDQVLGDPNRLPHSIIKESLDEIKNRFPNCRVVNLSFGDKAKIMTDGKNQFELASLIDDLSNEYDDTIFVISMGNIIDPLFRQEDFPDYLCEGRDDIRLFDPATSIHAISVGALQEDGDNFLMPSDFTRTGPGLNEMIKPELVELGGGFHKNMIVLNPNFLQRTFTLNSGTSFSAPIIANYFAELIKKFPEYSRNLIMSLLFASSKYPEPLLEPFPKLLSNINNDNFLKISNVYGYGKPNLENALSSDENRVVFKFEGSITIDHVRYFEIKIPDEFVTEKGNRFISVSLVFNPQINSNRADYFGTRMEFHMFRNRTSEELKEKYNQMDISDDSDSEEGKVPEELKRDEIKFKPSSNLRKKTPHQKGITKLSSRYKIDPSQPLTLVILCQKKWKLTGKQKFAVVVTMEHEKEIDLYNRLQTLNVIRSTIAPRVRV